MISSKANALLLPPAISSDAVWPSWTKSSNCLHIPFVGKKLISRSKKEMENFILAKLRIITGEEHLRKLQKLLSQLEVKAQLCKFFETEGCTLNSILLIIYTIHI